MGPSPAPVPAAHERPAEDEAQQMLAFGRGMMWLRLAAIALTLSQVPAYRLLSPWLIAFVAVLAAATAGASRLAIRPGVPVGPMRRRAAVFVASDILAVYLAGTAFVPDPKWVAFYFYPLLSLEATLAAGTLAGLLVTGMSVIVYLAQLSLHISMLNEVEMPQVIAALGLLSTTGAFMAISGGLAERGRRDLRVLLDLAQALVRERDPASAIGLLDQRVHDALGGRVRSIALRQPDGHMQLLRWSTGERRVLTRAQAASGLGDTAALDAQFAAGTSFTYETDAWSVVTSALGLPEWARAVTMVPISLEGRWIGVIPVLWATPRVPDRHELRLLYGIANQVGPALAQAGLLPSEGPGEPAEAAASDPPPDPSPDSVSDPAAARSQAVRGG